MGAQVEFEDAGHRDHGFKVLGTAAFVHYGVRMGDNVVLEPDSFLMKGEILDPGTSWLGNPARAVAGLAAQARAA